MTTLHYHSSEIRAVCVEHTIHIVNQIYTYLAECEHDRGRVKDDVGAGLHNPDNVGSEDAGVRLNDRVAGDFNPLFSSSSSRRSSRSSSSRMDINKRPGWCVGWDH